MEKATKLKLLKLWEILKKETDEENPISSTELMRRLTAMGVPCNRKTVYDDIKTLQEAGYDIICNRSSQNEYFVADRDFDVAELRILLDAVQGSAFITKKKTESITKKIATLAGEQKGEVLRNNIVEFNCSKSSNESIYYNVDTITSAITQGKKLRFHYFKHDIYHNRIYGREGDYYIVDPYSTVFANDNYYLIAYSFQRKEVVNYRVDRMDSVSVLEEDITLSEEVKFYDIKKQKSQLFGMFPGEEVIVGFEVDNSLIDAMFDKFGEKLSLYPMSEYTFGFVKNVQISPQFFGWCCGFGSKLKVLTPPTVVSSMKKWLDDMSTQYTKKKE